MLYRLPTNRRQQRSDCLSFITVLDVGALFSHPRPAVGCLSTSTSLSEAHHFFQGLASNFGSGFSSGGVSVYFRPCSEIQRIR
jgi:hypothetical protein